MFAASRPGPYFSKLSNVPFLPPKEMSVFKTSLQNQTLQIKILKMYKEYVQE